MEIMERAARHLATRPRSEKELYEYLVKKGYKKTEIDKAIALLKGNKYIDDKAYAATYFRYALGKKKSVFKIRYELKQKGISDDNIAQGIYLFEDENSVDIKELELQNAEAEAQKYFESNFKDREKKKALDKTARRLASLGYPSSMISSILEGLYERNL